MGIQDKNLPRTVFIIVTWNRKETLDQCLCSLKEHFPGLHKIVVVDNASSDGTSALVSSGHPDVLLIRNRENEGFGKANNRALDELARRSIPFDYVVFLNDDVRLEDGSLQALIRYMDEHPGIKASLPCVFREKRELQTGVAGYELSLKSALYYFSFLSLVFPRLFKGLFIHQRYFKEKGIILEVDWISGVCMALKGEVAGSLRFPEAFFMYAEDLALCGEIKRYGKIVYFPHSAVVHGNKTHALEARPRWIDSLFQYYGMKNKAGTAEKLALLKMIFVLGFLLRCLGYSFLNVVSGKENADKRRELLSFSRHILKGLFL